MGWGKANRTTLKSPSKNNVDKKENQQRFSFQRSAWVTYILESCQHVKNQSLTTPDCQEKEDKSSPRMSSLVGYLVPSAQPWIMYIQIIPNRLRRPYLYLCVCMSTCVTIIIKEKEAIYMSGGAWKGLEVKDKVGRRKGKERNYIIIFQLKILKISFKRVWSNLGIGMSCLHGI